MVSSITFGAPMNQISSIKDIFVCPCPRCMNDCLDCNLSEIAYEIFLYDDDYLNSRLIVNDVEL